ncbi:MAG: hypothetical protein ACYC7A_20785 [Thermoanaerobaculia bacterium]
MFHNKTFSGLLDREGRKRVCDLEFVECVFNSCSFSMPAHLLKRSHASHLKFVHCVAVNCDVGPAIIEDVTVDGLATNDPLILWSPFLTHVVLKGRIGEVKINSIPSVTHRSPDVVTAFANARTAHYAEVDWALDISDAAFDACDISGIPAAVIRRNRDTQVVVTREKALDTRWRARVPDWNSYWVDIVDLFLSEGDNDVVLVAPARGSRTRRQQLVDGLSNLRDLGVAEPE